MSRFLSYAIAMTMHYVLQVEAAQLGRFDPAYACGVVKCGGNRSVKPCSCDDLCSTYGDCCSDYNGTVSINQSGSDRVFIECADTNLNAAFFLVSKCPADWSDRYSREMCESNNLGYLEEYVIPVKSPDSRLSYKNFFCAFCHGLRNVQFWSYRFEHFFYQTDNWTFSALSQAWLHREVRFTFTEATRRPCLLYAHFCDLGESPNDKNRGSSTMCNTYIDLVYSRQYIFRNRYCAECSEQTVKPLQCFTRFDKFMKFPGLSSILRITSSTAIDRTASMKREVEVKCNVGWVYHQMKCQNTRCPSNFVSRRDKCMFTPDVSFTACGPKNSSGLIVSNIAKSSCHESERVVPKYFWYSSSARKILKKIRTVLNDTLSTYRLLRIDTYTKKEVMTRSLANCTAHDKTGSLATISANIIQFLESFRNATDRPRFINVTIRKGGNETLYAMKAKICKVTPLCKVLATTEKTPEAIKKLAWSYSINKTGVCEEVVRAYENQEREKRNRRLVQFLKKLHSAAEHRNKDTLLYTVLCVTMAFMAQF